MIDKYKVVKRPDPNAHFHFGVTLNDIQLDVIQHKSKEDSLVVTIAWEVGSEQQRRLRQMSENKRQALLHRMQQIIIAYTDLNFAYVPSAQNLNAVRLINPTYYDGLTKDRLHQAIRRVRNTLIALANTVISELGPPKSGQKKAYIT